MAEGTAGERGLRLDAVRNQERIVAAAAGAFAELGAEVTLEEVARRAGVGVATVYRRFRNRDQLVRAVVAHVLTAEIEPVAEIETDDPWRDLAATLEASVAAVAAHSEVVALAHAAGAIDVDVVDRYLHRLDRVLTRARAAGLVRPELEPRDLAVAVMMVLATVRKVDGTAAGTRAAGGAATWRCCWTACGRPPAPAATRFAGQPEPQAVPASSPPASGRCIAPTNVSSGPARRWPMPPWRPPGGRELRTQAGEQQHRASRCRPASTTQPVQIARSSGPARHGRLT